MLVESLSTTGKIDAGVELGLMVGVVGGAGVVVGGGVGVGGERVAVEEGGGGGVERTVDGVVGELLTDVFSSVEDGGGWIVDGSGGEVSLALGEGGDGGDAGDSG